MGKLLNLLTMFGPLTAAKFWFSLVMAGVHFVRLYWGIDLGLDEATALTIINGIWAAGVWLLPNKRRDIPVLTEDEARARAGGYSGPIVDRSRR
ncbi:hypothetical protein [Pelagibacterium lacus]|uniref:Uncharacterized protein n=1 Tax=Pelagibacterium lacus TaxID=2282655 RepID=A0A369W188_9HYPH|nr:hypothetical protein [Pelagibacterium lacus]RDE08444.1 hypothetical protein DVH29_11275 [Pelagibacterium lacus]